MIKTAGFSSIKVLGDMHKFRSTDPRTKDLEEGLNPIQVSFFFNFFLSFSLKLYIFIF